MLFFLSQFILASDCIDSDKGINYYEKGKIYGINDAVLGGFVELNDYCEGNILHEFYCMDLSNANTTYNLAVGKIDFECPDICQNGVCGGSIQEEIKNSQKEGNSSPGKESSSDDKKEPALISGNLINSSQIKEEPKQQIINLNQKKEDNSSDNSLFAFLGGIFLLLIIGVLGLSILIKTKKRKIIKNK